MLFKNFVVILSFLCVLFFSSDFAFSGEVQEGNFNWGGAVYKIRLEYVPSAKTTFISLFQIDRKGEERILQPTRSASGDVQLLIAPNFFGKKRDAVAFKWYEGSAAFMGYGVYYLDKGELRKAKVEQGIPRGELVADGNILQLWSGVRMWILYCPEKRYVVKDFPIFRFVSGIGGPVGDRVVEFKIEDGEVVFADPSILETGLKIKIGHDLLLLRTDFNSGGEKVEFVGEIIMKVKYPNTFTILSGDCELCIMPDGDPRKEKRFRLVAVEK